MKIQKRKLWVSIKEKFVIQVDLAGGKDLIEIFKGRYIQSTIPCYSYLEEKPPTDTQGEIQIKSTEYAKNIVKFNLRKNRIRLSVTPDRLYKGDVVYLLFLLFTKILQEKGYFLVHGASVSHDDKAVLLVGPSESGKTMVSLSLCIKHGFSLVASDMALLKREGNRILVVGGTKECSMYPGTIEAVFGKESRKIFSKQLSNKLWDKKIDISETILKQAGIRYEEGVPFNAIYYLRIQETPFFAKPLNEVAAKIKTLGMLSEWIRGANNMVISTNSLVPSFDTKNAEKERLLAVEIISTSTRQYSLYGNLQEVVKFIAAQK